MKALGPSWLVYYEAGLEGRASRVHWLSKCFHVVNADDTGEVLRRPGLLLDTLTSFVVLIYSAVSLVLVAGFSMSLTPCTSFSFLLFDFLFRVTIN